MQPIIRNGHEFCLLGVRFGINSYFYMGMYDFKPHNILNANGGFIILPCSQESWN
ncbi:hypothetical protein [Legionella pneumophila]|uniref:hypothetical protein n=1 Tax=Legionella pneumophila TaxID=446 RepID=UPI0020BFBBD5|nr:hypothetical protein [Legionella pneumophila]MDO5218957.1 hypothetical protein [Legionella pneumophila]MDO5275016.1 hypothetical protein [Legionella pneumophila]